MLILNPTCYRSVYNPTFKEAYVMIQQVIVKIVVKIYVCLAFLLCCSTQSSSDPVFASGGKPSSSVATSFSILIAFFHPISLSYLAFDTTWFLAACNIFDSLHHRAPNSSNIAQRISCWCLSKEFQWSGYHINKNTRIHACCFTSECGSKVISTQEQPDGNNLAYPYHDSDSRCEFQVV